MKIVEIIIEVLIVTGGVITFYLLSKLQMKAWLSVLEKHFMKNFKDQQTVNTNNDEKEQE
jgi:hypothetical protein